MQQDLHHAGVHGDLALHLHRERCGRVSACEARKSGPPAGTTCRIALGRAVGNRPHLWHGTKAPLHCR
eukprot:12704024-Prorocentrum_lima.AAC.1